MKNLSAAEYLFTAFFSAIGALFSYLAKRHGKINEGKLDDVKIKAAEVQAKTEQIQTQTNGLLEAKIREAVVQVFNEHKADVTEAVMAESVRHLLDSMLNGESRNGP